MIFQLIKQKLLNFILFIGRFSVNNTHVEEEHNFDIISKRKGYSIYLTKKGREKLIEATNKKRFEIHISNHGYNENASIINRFTIKSNKKYIAEFSLSGFHGCCGLCILSNVNVNREYENKGVGTVIHELAERIAISLNYGCIICTDKVNNIGENKVLEKREFNKSETFINPKTNNTLNIYVKPLNQKKLIQILYKYEIE